MVQDAGVHGGYGTGGSLEAQLAELRDDFKRYKRETEDRLAALNSEVHKCGGFAYQLYQYLLSGGPQGPPGMLQVSMLLVWQTYRITDTPTFRFWKTTGFEGRRMSCSRGVCDGVVKRCMRDLRSTVLSGGDLHSDDSFTELMMNGSCSNSFYGWATVLVLVELSDWLGSSIASIFQCKMGLEELCTCNMCA